MSTYKFDETVGDSFGVLLLDRNEPFVVFSVRPSFEIWVKEGYAFKNRLINALEDTLGSTELVLFAASKEDTQSGALNGKDFIPVGSDQFESALAELTDNLKEEESLRLHFLVELYPDFEVGTVLSLGELLSEDLEYVEVHIPSEGAVAAYEQGQQVAG